MLEPTLYDPLNTCNKSDTNSSASPISSFPASSDSDVSPSSVSKTSSSFKLSTPLINSSLQNLNPSEKISLDNNEEVCTGDHVSDELSSLYIDNTDQSEGFEQVTVHLFSNSNEMLGSNCSFPNLLHASMPIYSSLPNVNQSKNKKKCSDTYEKIGNNASASDHIPFSFSFDHINRRTEFQRNNQLFMYESNESLGSLPTYLPKRPSFKYSGTNISQFTTTSGSSVITQKFFGSKKRRSDLNETTSSGLTTLWSGSSTKHNICSQWSESKNVAVIISIIIAIFFILIALVYITVKVVQYFD